MSISGLLGTMNLPEILQWIKFGQKSGTAVFERGRIVKKIYFENGLVVSASSNDPKEYLGQLLMFFGWIDEEKLNEAFHLQGKTQKLLGKVMVENYGLTEEQLHRALRIKIEETIYDIFIWEEGRFIYSNELVHLSDHDRLDTALTVDQMLFEGARRIDEWREFRKHFPSDDVVFDVKGGRRSLGEYDRDFIFQKIYSLIDGSRGLRRILLESRAPEFRGYEVFGKLHSGGFIEAVKKSMKAAKPSAEADASSRLSEAMQAYKDKRLEESFQLLEKLMNAEVPDHEAETLFNVVREAYFQDLKATVPDDGVPELKIDISQLSEKILSSREGFLASRVNGQWDVKSLIMISPLGDVDSRRILKRLLDEGVIAMKRK